MIDFDVNKYLNDEIMNIIKSIINYDNKNKSLNFC